MAGWLYPIPVPDAVPAEVSRAQAKIALTEAELWGQAEAAVASFNSERAAIWFADAGTWRRDHVYVSVLGYEIGLDDAGIDALFRTAANIL